MARARFAPYPAAMSTHLHIDPFAGIAGDMFLGACIDLGAPLEQIAAAFAPVTLAHPYELTADRVLRSGIEGVDFKVYVNSGTPHEHHHTHDHGHHHHHTGYSDLMHVISHIDANERAKGRAERIVTELAKAEAAVHGIDIEKVHFHEVGAVDSIIDLIGAAVAVELLGVDTVSCAPLPLGHGTVKCAHGVMPLPAPATARILHGVPTYGVDRRCETVTPSGAAIAKALADEFDQQPPMRTERTGYGAGDRDDPGIANLLRLQLGERVSP